MKAITDITKLVQGQELIRVLNGEVHYYEFLMIHPHNPEYIFCMNFCKRAERFYKSEVYKQFFTDYTDRDLINVRRDYALKTLKECDMALKELGAEWALGTVTRINELAKQAHETAVRRGKTSEDASHLDTFFDILSELKEFREASEIDPSEHLPEYTQAQEELTDVLICCLTELHRRGVNVEEIIKAKIEFNKTRI